MSCSPWAWRSLSTGRGRITTAPARGRFDPTQPIQAYDIATTNLEVGKLYYYRVVRPKEAPGDTLNASVLLAKVQVR
jgi:hypothetical protein